MKRRNCGFTLIELIMTIVVTAIIAIPLSLTISQQMESTFQSRGFTEALNLARYEMEIVNNLPYTNVNSVTTNNYLGYPYNVVRTVNVIASGGGEGLKQIIVQVRRAGSATDVVRLVTYYARNVRYPIDP